MTDNELTTLLAGLNGDTPLGYMVKIRSEEDPEVLKTFTKAQHSIRDEWREKHSKYFDKLKADKEERNSKECADILANFFGF